MHIAGKSGRWIRDGTKKWELLCAVTVRKTAVVEDLKEFGQTLFFKTRSSGRHY